MGKETGEGGEVGGKENERKEEECRRGLEKEEEEPRCLVGAEALS